MSKNYALFPSLPEGGRPTWVGCGFEFHSMTPMYRLTKVLVVNATLWLDGIRNRILLYGGAFPYTSGDVDTLPQAIWSYELIQDSWSAVDAKGDPVSRATSGASAFVNEVGYYRGGQQDAHTTPGYPEPAGFRLLAGYGN